MLILGLSAFYHDSAACLIKDGAIVAAAQEERFTRKKHDPDYPQNAVRFCLQQAGAAAKDIDHIVFYEKPFLKFERILETYLATAPFGLRSFVRSMPVWLRQKLWIKDLVAEKTEFTKPILFTEHHQSHAASAFFPSPFQEAAVLTMDGVGEWATASYGVGRGNRIEILKEIRFPHSPGMLYSAFTYYLGFRVNSGEYKVMGLAPYGTPAYKDLILSKLVELKEDGSFKLNMEYFDYCSGLTMTNRRFDALFGGKPRKPEEKLTQRHMDIASSIQEVIGEMMLLMARHVRKSTGMENACLAGGVALNCVGNGRILREKIFKELWIQPAAGDAGGALGAALSVWHEYLGNPRRPDSGGDSMRGSFLGPEFSDDAIKKFLDAAQIPFTRLGRAEIAERVSDLIAQGNVIGWFEGRMEFGPRALGARSILGDPRDPKMQETMNLKIKFRESFRPFAPSVLAERADDYFEMQGKSDYMLVTAPLRASLRVGTNEEEKCLRGIDMLKARRSSIPAVTHVDHSARVQTVDAATNPLFYETLKRFDEKHGCAVIVNTSFNVRGEPIVCTPEEAYACFMRTNIDHLVLGSFLIDKKLQKTVSVPGAGHLKKFDPD